MINEKPAIIMSQMALRKCAWCLGDQANILFKLAVFSFVNLAVFFFLEAIYCQIKHTFSAQIVAFRNFCEVYFCDGSLEKAKFSAFLRFSFKNWNYRILILPKLVLKTRLETAKIRSAKSSGSKTLFL